MTSDSGNNLPPPLPPQAHEVDGHIPPHMPVAALPYQLPQTEGRPGILTAVGVISIMLAVISMMVSTVSGCYGVALFVGSKAMASAASASATTTTTNSPPGSVSATFVASSTTTTTASPVAPPVAQPPTNQDGLGPADRQIALDTLNSIRRLSDPRRRQLDVFLAQSGQDLFPTAGRPLTAAMVRATINSGKRVAASGGSSGSVTFVGSRGTLIVDDDSVEFQRPGVLQPIVTTASPTTVPAGPAIRFGYVALTAAEAQQVAQAAGQMAAPKGLSPAQSATLIAELQKPTQQLLAAGSIPSPVASASNLPDGSVSIQFSGGSTMTIDAKGMVTQLMNPTAAVASAFKIAAPAAIAVALDAAVSIALAVLLLVAAILVIRQGKQGRRLHRIYAWVKIPFAFAGWAAIVWLWFGFMSGMTAALPRGPAYGLTFAWSAIVLGVISCMYPVALLIVFRTRTVRDYYAAVEA